MDAVVLMNENRNEAGRHAMIMRGSLVIGPGKTGRREKSCIRLTVDGMVR